MADFDCPSWLTGVARTLDIGGFFDIPYAPMPPALADSLALARDLEMVRQDMYNALAPCVGKNLRAASARQRFVMKESQRRKLERNVGT